MVESNNLPVTNNWLRTIIYFLSKTGLSFDMDFILMKMPFQSLIQQSALKRYITMKFQVVWTEISLKQNVIVNQKSTSVVQTYSRSKFHTEFDCTIFPMTLSKRFSQCEHIESTECFGSIKNTARRVGHRSII